MGHTFDESRLLPKPCLPRPPDSVRLQLTGRHPGRYLPHSTQHAALESPGRRTHRLGGARTSNTSLICKPKTKTRSGCTPDAGAKKLTMLRVVHRKQAQQTQKTARQSKRSCCSRTDAGTRVCPGPCVWMHLRVVSVTKPFSPRSTREATGRAAGTRNRTTRGIQKKTKTTRSISPPTD